MDLKRCCFLFASIRCRILPTKCDENGAVVPSSNSVHFNQGHWVTGFEFTGLAISISVFFSVSLSLLHILFISLPLHIYYTSPVSLSLSAHLSIAFTTFQSIPISLYFYPYTPQNSLSASPSNSPQYHITSISLTLSFLPLSLSPPIKRSLSL